MVERSEPVISCSSVYMPFESGTSFTAAVNQWYTVKAVIQGNKPCKVVREITEEDRKYYFKDKEFDVLDY
ncbi:hypothetical protein D3C73_1134020 [compost metagenome]